MPEPSEHNLQSHERMINLADLERRQSSSYREVYSNNANAQSGFFDIRLIFSQIIVPMGKTKEAVVQEEVGVAMCWEHAKALHKLLGALIHTYETANNIVLREQPKAAQMEPFSD